VFEDRAVPPVGSIAPGAAPPAEDPRAVRVDVSPATRVAGEEALVVSPPPEPIAPLPDSLAGRGLFGGIARAREQPGRPVPAGEPYEVLVDGVPASVRFERRGGGRVLLREGSAPTRRIVLGTDVTGPDGRSRREVLVDGWRIEVEVEPARRSALRERARRGREASGHGGTLEVRAIIPGRVVAVSVAQGDAVAAGQQILVVEAMKMQNELRAPRDGVVRRVAVVVGGTIEVGDLLLVIE
jgi:biotin carboxyl carrier protein